LLWFRSYPDNDIHFPGNCQYSIFTHEGLKCYKDTLTVLLDTFNRITIIRNNSRGDS